MLSTILSKLVLTMTKLGNLIPVSVDLKHRAEWRTRSNAGARKLLELNLIYDSGQSYIEPETKVVEEMMHANRSVSEKIRSVADKTNYFGRQTDLDSLAVLDKICSMGG